MKFHILLLNKPMKITLLSAGLCVFLLATNPNYVPSIVLIVPFLLLAMILYQFVIAGFSFANNTHTSENFKPSVFRLRLMACLAAGFPVLLILLQSIGQLSVKDIITVVAIFVLAYFYVGKVAPRSAEGQSR